MRNANEVSLERRALRGRDLVVFANDWGGDPLSKMHLMRIFARENRILWVNSLGNRRPKANTHDAKRIWHKLQSFGRGLREAEPNLYVLTPLAVPLYGASTQPINGALLRKQVSGAMRQLAFHRPISWSFLPSSAPVSGTLGEALAIYHCVDEFAAFDDTNGKEIAELERKLLGKVDLVITSAERLFERKRALNPNTVLVRHGVDYAHFVRACDPATVVAPEIAELPKPVLGFFGLVAHWVDLEAIAACAKAFPTGSVVVLGKVMPDVDPRALEALPNVHLLGRRPYAELPSFCKGFDVALLPFLRNELTFNCNPLKVREYLAAGLPVVATDLPEVRRLGQCVLADSAADFPAKVRACLADGGGPRRERAERVISERWEAKAEEIRHHVGESLVRLGKSI